MNKKKVILIVVGVLLIISLVIGASYALWINTVTQKGSNVVNSDCFKISFTDKDTIYLDNAYPILDSAANDLTPYQFTIKNVCENAANFQVNLETLSTSTLASLLRI